MIGSLRAHRLLTVAVVLLVACAGLIVTKGGSSSDRTLTATFARTTSLYVGAQVKVLGVRVGTVEAIKVKGAAVETRISYDAGVKVPADVHALIVPPSIVGDRFVQLAPAYETGPTLPDHARLGLDRTGVPVELDETYRTVDEVARALGPRGANADGAVSRLVTATARNLAGHGDAFNAAVRELANAIGTVAGSSGDVNATVSNLATLTATLAGKDAELRALVSNLARVGAQLNGQREDISGAVVALEGALGDVDRLTRKNRAALKTAVSRATSTSSGLAARREELGDLLALAPVGLSNLANIYVPKNWDPSKPWDSVLAGRTGSSVLRADLFSDLDTQLGSTLGGICAALPAAQQERLSALCGALSAAGSSIGGLLSTVIESSAGRPTSGALSLDSLLGGRR